MRDGGGRAGRRGWRGSSHTQLNQLLCLDGCTGRRHAIRHMEVQHQPTSHHAGHACMMQQHDHGTCTQMQAHYHACMPRMHAGRCTHAPMTLARTHLVLCKHEHLGAQQGRPGQGVHPGARHSACRSPAAQQQHMYAHTFSAPRRVGQRAQSTGGGGGHCRAMAADPIHNLPELGPGLRPPLPSTPSPPPLPAPSPHGATCTAPARQ